MSLLVRKPGRSLAHKRSDGGSFADEIRAVGIWLKNGVRDDAASVEAGTGTRTEVFDDVCLLSVFTLAVAVAAADKQECDDSQRSQDGAASHNASDD